MKKFTGILLIVLMALTLIGTSMAGGGENKLTVYASFYPMYDFAQKVGGDRANVSNMVPSGTEPHDWEPDAMDIVGLENADVFVYNGVGMEHWVEKVLKSLENKDLIAINTSEGLTLMEGHHHEEDAAEEEADGEMQYDPHVWLNPMNAKAQMEKIKNVFCQADPTNAAYYEENFAKYADEFDALDELFRQTLAPIENKEIIVSHEAFGYLCSAYGLMQVGIEGLMADSEPDPARMVEIIEFAKEHQVSTIFFEEMVNPKVAETIAKATGAVTEVLNPLEGLSDEETAAGDDYFSVMQKNLQALVKALQ